MAGPTAPQEERLKVEERSPLLQALDRRDALQEELPEPEAVKELSTPAILRLLDNPDLKLPANAKVGAAVWRELLKREGVAFTLRAMRSRRVEPDPEKSEAKPEADGGASGGEVTGGGATNPTHRSGGDGPSAERLAPGNRRISAAPKPRDETKDAGGAKLAGVGGARAEAPGRETSGKAAQADGGRQAKRRVVEEGLTQERGKDANGHVSYWVSDGAEVAHDDKGWGVRMRTLDLHTRVHVRGAADPNFSAIDDFGPYYGGAFDTSFAEFTGIVLHEQTHVEEVRAAWGALWPEFQANVAGIQAASPGGAEAQYRALFEEFDQALFEQYFASGEEGARAKEWAHYHEQYDKLVGKPEGKAGGASQAKEAGKRHGAKESAQAQAKAGLKEAGAGKRADGKPDPVRCTVMDITSVIESGAAGASAINDYDDGIVSYGYHQATLASGALEAVLTRYIESGGDHASDLAAYMSRVKSKDASLRRDKGFKALLKKAGKDPVMRAAQHDSFGDDYYVPAKTAATAHGLRSPLGISMLYDTNIQGGMGLILKRTVRKLGGKVGDKGITEVQFLNEFNARRKARLLALANSQELRGKAANGRALRNSAKRCDELQALLDADNLTLAGKFAIKGTPVEGLLAEEAAEVEEEMTREEVV